MATSTEGDDSPSAPHAGVDPRLRTGRHPGDRRVRIDRPHARYFRHAAPNLVVARPEVDAPTDPTARLTTAARRRILGAPIATADEHGERLTKVKALATFSSDNLSSVAYATELILFTLIAAGTQSFWLLMPISILIVGIFGLIVASYRQTIRAYPGGGGSYLVAKANLGTGPALLAAAALLTDYVLTVSVSVAAGTAAIASAFPGALGDLRVELSIVAVAVVMVVNLRGLRESGTIFALPTYVFLVSTLALITMGIVRTVLGDPPRVEGVTAVTVPAETLGVLLLMRAFADGCSAITGVEAVSNGVPAFKSPEWRNARATLTAMGLLVAVMFLGLSWLAGVAHALPSTDETVISQIGRAVFGTGVAYYVLQISTTGILILAANTSFADFPRLASILAADGFMPRRFAFRGERLAFTAGIVALAVIACLVLVVFGGRVEALIPLYAIGVFTSITVSQTGMVRHWLRERGPDWRRSLSINAVGAVVCAGVTVTFAVAKFALGAWSIVIIIPTLVGAMLLVHRHYERRRLEVAVRPEIVIPAPRRHQRVFVPVREITRDVVNAIRFGRTMSDDVVALHVTDDPARAVELRERFARQLPDVPFVIVESPYRTLVGPLVRWLELEAADDGDDLVVVLLPEVVASRWWERWLHNDNARRIRRELLGRPGILVAQVPFGRTNRRLAPGGSPESAGATLSP